MAFSYVGLVVDFVFVMIFALGLDAGDVMLCGGIVSEFVVKVGLLFWRCAGRNELFGGNIWSSRRGKLKIKLI